MRATQKAINAKGDVTRDRISESPVITQRRMEWKGKRHTCPRGNPSHHIVRPGYRFHRLPEPHRHLLLYPFPRLRHRVHSYYQSTRHKMQKSTSHVRCASRPLTP